LGHVNLVIFIKDGSLKFFDHQKRLFFYQK
jgi:hypothetical protein